MSDFQSKFCCLIRKNPKSHSRIASTKNNINRLRKFLKQMVILDRKKEEKKKLSEISRNIRNFSNHKSTFLQVLSNNTELQAMK